MEDRIEKTIDLNAPVERVWRALSDPHEFGKWFQVRIEDPFVIGKVCRGIATSAGYEGLRWEVHIEVIEPEQRFAFSWCPYEHDDARDFSTAPKTLVEFRLEPTDTGTRLTISESGFSALPDDPNRMKAFRMNSGGWDWQADNLLKYLES